MMKKVKSKRSNRIRRRRTSLEIDEEQSRTLYIRLPHSIKDEKEIKELFFGDFTVKLPRQTTRYCHVIFPSIEEKIKNLKAIKKKLVDGKPVFAAPPKPINLEKKKKKQKKIVIPEPKDESSSAKYLFISNLEPGVKCSQLREFFPEARSIALLKGLRDKTRQAKVKMPSIELCNKYIKKEVEWPTILGRKVKIALAKRSKKSKKKEQKKSVPLKIYDGKNEQTTSNEGEDQLESKTEEDTEEDEEESEDEDLETSEDEGSEQNED